MSSKQSKPIPISIDKWNPLVFYFVLWSFYEPLALGLEWKKEFTQFCYIMEQKLLFCHRRRNPHFVSICSIGTVWGFHGTENCERNKATKAESCLLPTASGPQGCCKRSSELESSGATKWLNLPNASSRVCKAHYGTLWQRWFAAKWEIWPLIWPILKPKIHRRYPDLPIVYPDLSTLGQASRLHTLVFCRSCLHCIHK